MRVEETGGGIQKIIHQIWIGDNPVPQEWMDTVKAFADKHGYEYKLWGDNSINELDANVIPGLRELYDKFADQPAGRADILRILALYKHGGIYIDADSVIMKDDKFAKFLDDNRAPVFFGWEDLDDEAISKLGDIGEDNKKARRLVANGLMGGKKGHALLKRILEGLVENTNSQKEKGSKEAWQTVGPLYVTNVYNKTREEFPDLHIYPMKYFYPIRWHGITDHEMHKKITIPEESMLFQYGYSTNGFGDIFRKLREKGKPSSGGKRSRRTRRKNKRKQRQATRKRKD